MYNYDTLRYYIYPIWLQIEKAVENCILLSKCNSQPSTGLSKMAVPEHVNLH